MTNIHYIGFYTDDENRRNLKVVPSSITKMRYVISVLKRIGCQVNVFSTAWTTNRDEVHFKAKNQIIDDNETVRYVDTFGSRIPLLRKLNVAWAIVQLLIYLVFSVKKEDVVIIYHSPIYMPVIKVIKLIKKNKIIIQVEESYGHLFKLPKRKKEVERNYLKSFSYYILANDLIVNWLGIEDKPFLVCYGSYTVNDSSSGVQYERIKIVYAGTISKTRPDAFISVQAAEFLNDKYQLSIMGFGNDEDIDDLIKTINGVNNRVGSERVSFLGLKTGKQYLDILNESHIGLSPRSTTEEYTKLSFPSKVVIYMCNGLVPLCSPIDSLKQSSIADLLEFYSEETPRAISEAVLRIDLSKSEDIKRRISILDSEMLIQMKRILGSHCSRQ